MTKPGDQLHNYLSKLGFHISPGCGCERRIRLMNEWGPEKCLEKIDSINRWLKREAISRGLPYSSTLGKQLIKRAIKTSIDPSSK